MSQNPWTATTRTSPLARAPSARPEHLLAPNQVVESPETHLQYRVERLIGEGGFGQAYLARRLGRSATVPAVVCIKVSTRIDGWLREAYFGQVLDGHERAIRVFDAFPLIRDDGRVLYFLVLEYAEHGDLGAFLRRGGKGWAETIVRREIAGILDVLRKLHRGQTLHRDLTPVNVFVCDGPRLKLGDFGIVRQQSDMRGITARTMTWVRDDGPPCTLAPARRAAVAASLRRLLKMPVKARWTPLRERRAPALSGAGGLRSASIRSSALSYRLRRSPMQRCRISFR